MAITDEAAAAAALASLVQLSPAQAAAHDEILATLLAGNEDSFIDTARLLALYNTLYFDSQLLPRTELAWSARLTLCAGTCELVRDGSSSSSSSRTRATATRMIRIKLSEPLLKLRPRADLLNTLLHECIHAYLFVTSDYAHVRDPTGGHGAGFQALAAGINAHGGYAITQFHTFHDEVDSYRTHVWLCDGVCRSQPPHFGLVKRAMNRAPGKSDTWWTQHAKECGGSYVKIAEPGLTRKQLESLPALQRAGRQRNKIDAYVKSADSSDATRNSNRVASKQTQTFAPGFKRAQSTELQPLSAAKVMLVACPVCDEAVKEIYVNEHLDKVHGL